MRGDLSIALAKSDSRFMNCSPAPAVSRIWISIGKPMQVNIANLNITWSLDLLSGISLTSSLRQGARLDIGWFVKDILRSGLNGQLDRPITNSIANLGKR